MPWAEIEKEDELCDHCKVVLTEPALVLQIDIEDALFLCKECYDHLITK